MKNQVKTQREKLMLTQNELAEKSGLSLRTIQRIEAGYTPKGYTLKILATTLESTPELLFPKENEQANVQRAKLINLATLTGLLIPYANIFLPLYLTFKTNDSKNKALGKRIVSIQIILTLLLSMALIASPFIQKSLNGTFPLFLVIVVSYVLLNIFIVIKNSISLNKNYDLHTSLNFSFL